jgi:Carboxypeptidase regulatory-like domain/TonB dependent receptor
MNHRTCSALPRLIKGSTKVLFSAAVAMLLLVSPRLLAQAVNGDVTGLVKDPSGAVIVKATVVITNEDTGIATTVETGSGGQYHVGNLLPGKYDIVVTASGFQPYALHGVLIELNKTSTNDIGLTVGASTSVEVSADAGAVLDTTSTNLTTTFSNEEISELPTAAIGGVSSSGVESGVLNLSLLSPGVASAGGLGIGTGPSIGGQRPRNNNFEIEGIDNNNKAVTGPLVYIANDAVGGFTLITNQFSPDFGHSSGGQFNTNVLSGTNTFHGKIYEYFQNRNLNASSGIAGGKIPNPKYDDNRYGGQIGGPIFKDRLFFFTNFERNTVGQNTSAYICVPTSAGVTMLNSLASSYGFSANNLAQFTKATPLPNFLGGAQVSAANDNACGNEVSGLQTFTVTNNQTGSGALSSNIPLGNYQINAGAPLLFDQIAASVDYNINDKDSLRLRYIHDWESATDTGASSGETILPAFFTQQPFKWHLFALSEYHTFTPNLTNEFRIGFNRYSNTLTAGNFTYPGLDSYPELNYYDLGNLQLGTDGNAPQFTIQNLYQVTDNVSYIKGKHTFKIGFDGRKYISPQGFTQRERGDYEWNTTDQFLHDLAPDSSGFAERSAGNHTYYGDQVALYGYANDTYRIAPRVTINAGLRYEFTSVPTGERAQGLNIAASVPGLVSFNAPQPTYTALAPRVGINWAPDEKTSVRAGFGIAYDVLFDNLGTLTFPPQYSVTEDVGSAGYPNYLAPNFLKNGGLPTASGSGTVTYPNTTAGILAERNATSALLPNQILPYAETYTVTVQRTFATYYTAELGYIGTRGIHLPTQDQINVQPKVTPANQLYTESGTTFLEPAGTSATDLADIQALSNIVPAWLAAGFTTKITSYQPYSQSEYNALVANLTRRFQKGVQMNLSYTYSKTSDDATDEVFATVLTPRRQQNSQCIKCDYSRSALDRTNRISLEMIYDVPAYKHSDNLILKEVVGNWLISPMYTYESPEFATVLSGDNANLNGDSGAAIDRTIINPQGHPGTGTGVTAVMSGSNIIGYKANDPSAYYVQAAAGTLPNSQRNTLAIRPIDNIDLSLVKKVTVRERYSLELGLAAYNLFNHPQYQPGTIDNVNGPSYTASYNFQTVTNAFFNHPEKQFLNNARTMALSGKINF